VAIDRDTTRGEIEATLFDAAPTEPHDDESDQGSTYEVGDDDHDRRVTRLAYGRHLRVMLVESEEPRAADFTRAADESVLDVRVEHASDAEIALARLERTSGSLMRRPLPDVILVSLPTDEAHRLLERLQHDERFDQMPILVLADTANPVAERRSFALGATAHLVAPRQDYERVALVHALPDFIPRARAVHAHLESHRR
jgi:CheY-like chemotaxis protein